MYPRTGDTLANQPESLHCGGFFSSSPPHNLLLTRLEAWEASPVDLALDVFDLAAFSASSDMTRAQHLQQEPFHPSLILPSHLWTMTSTMATLEPVYAGHTAHRDHELDVCLSPPASTSAAPRRRSSPPAAGAVNGLVSPEHDADHMPIEFALDSGSPRSFLGALYHSYALWELASFLSAIAWLLVCLAA